MKRRIAALAVLGLAGHGVLGPVTGLGMSAWAAPTDPMLSAQFEDGKYLRAAEAAERLGSADDLAFAARSLLALCMTGPSDIDADVLDRAYQNAAKAVSIDRGHVEGRLQMAIAASLQTRSMTLMEANRSGLANLGKLLVEGVLEDEPDNFYAHGFAAVWHVEARRRAGAFGAMVVGASLKDARVHYEAAARLAPDDVGVHWSYGRALVAQDARRHREPAEAALVQAITASADNHVERVMQVRAERLLGELRADVDAAEAAALEML